MDLLLNTNFFIGDEVEGKYKGTRTLFVKGDQSFDEIKEYIYQYEVLQVYFGAAMQSQITNWETIKEIAYYFYDGLIVTVEILLPRDINIIPKEIVEDERIHKVFTFKRDFTFNSITVKIENEDGIYCYPLPLIPIYNSWNVYGNDKDISREKEGGV